MTQQAGRTPHTPLVFLHNEKAAGVTMHVILRRQYSRRGSYTIDGADVDGSIQRLREMPEEERHRILCLKGHMPFGLHSLLADGARYITMVRDPVARIASLYRYIRAHPGHRLHDEVVKRHADLASFVASDLPRQVNEAQTRRLAGVTRLGPRAGFEGSPDEIFDMAMRNIETHFAAVGLQDRFVPSVVLFARRLDWTVRPFARYNVTAERPERVPDDVADAIRAANPLDDRVYRWAQQRFDADVASEGTGFRTDLARLEAGVSRLERRLAPWQPVMKHAERVGRRVRWLRELVTG